MFIWSTPFKIEKPQIFFMTQSMYMLIYFISKFIIYEFFRCRNPKVKYYSCPHPMEEENSYRCDWYFSDETNGYQQSKHCLWLKTPNKTITSPYIDSMDPTEFGMIQGSVLSPSKHGLINLTSKYSLLYSMIQKY